MANLRERSSPWKTCILDHLGAWDEDGEALLTGPDLVQQTTEKVKLIQDRLKASQSRQKSYADKRRKPLEFAVGDHVFLRVTPTTGVERALRAKKLSPKKYVPDPSHVLEVEDIQVREDLSMEVQPVRVNENQTKWRNGRNVRLVKVVWDERTSDSNWEVADEMRSSYPHLFTEENEFTLEDALERNENTDAAP
ncbi:uncharacterized protein LOC111240604 [Vigna radiata var. radiata]|uniref:Uncharacterized protein LOC111240604 n=1 Tax=Vigna radiata var. radiata TaxID=3916 RepID=A0A3Q0EMW3_VIGRR|nr:uncharacterized protein LOC111240604 [Vigna radiata var. radiata]